MRKTIIFSFTIVLFLGLVSSCKKKSDRDEAASSTTKGRDTIQYLLSIHTRAENKIGDTLLFKINGGQMLYSKGSVADQYGPWKVKTGDRISLHYYPGTFTKTDGSKIMDENGLEISVFYEINNNQTLKKFSCRCVGDFDEVLQ